MIRPRNRKLLRDLSAARGRVAVMVIAIAVALAGVGALLIARTVMMREAAAAYAATNPAGATLDVAGGVDAALLAQVRRLPGVTDAAARQTVTTRVRVGGEWRRMVLFVISPDDPRRVAGFRVDAGTWPPAGADLLLERAAGPELNAKAGDTLDIAGPTGTTTAVRVAGTVYDPSLAPAGQERTGYGYLTPAGLARLGFTPSADDLKIVPGTRDQAAVDTIAADVAAWLAGQGRTVHLIQAPPDQHPHQNQTNTITGLFLAFAVAALVLAGILTAATLGGMLAAQTRQIGVMKAVGATTGQLLRLYLTAAAAIAAAATLLAVGPAIAAGYGLTALVADLLNVDVTSYAVPWWVPVAYAAAGLGTPLLVAVLPLTRAARITVRTALDDHGATQRPGRRGERRGARLRGGRTATLAWRNLLRRRGRLALTVALLAAGGALFTSGLNSAAAWQRWVDDGLARRAYDAELTLARPAPVPKITAAVRTVGAVRAVEPVVSLPVAPARADGRIAVQRTYPDGGHGRFQLTGLPADTAMVDFEVRAGRWLEPGDTGAVVLNQGALQRLGDPRIGDDVHLSVDGVDSRWRIVGTVAEVGGPATAYTVPGGLARLGGIAGTVRIAVTGDVAAATAEVEAALAAAGLPVAEVLPTTELRQAVDQHVAIFIYTLIALAAMTAVVGILGLTSAMSIAVTERTREYGIMQAVGATPGTIRRLVLAEGTLTGLIGFLVAVLLGLPLSAFLGDFLGELSFRLPLPLQLSAGGLAGWLVLAVAGAAAATLTAARRAAGLTIRETLTHQ